ncbi:cbb3-type cytochrome oxidase assembly protein CcoS [Pedobacter antarcticus]|uniref:cbb3-type cytochrome oxidase assembly protein CcoS n=1 Tax=Pedobacter antarcticus TaxID=34086 RepID=UPI001C575769|nr:cbb3-type cytochrome oxidase assembly protein CcoS [Pedobacter antarcticus]
MNMIFILIGFSMLLALIFLIAFFWASKSGQNDDLYTPGVRILFDDDKPVDDVVKSDEDHQAP